MPSKISDVLGVSKAGIERRQDVSQFIRLVEVALQFAPDRQDGPALSSAKSTKFSEIHSALTKEFFSELYSEREEKQSLIQYLQARRVVLVHGLAGTGKTVLLMELAPEHGGEVPGLQYFDLKELADLFLAQEGNLLQILRSVVYRKIRAKYVENDSRRLREWTVYKLRNDPAYERVLSTIQDISHTTITDDELLLRLEQPEIRELLARIDEEQTTLGWLLRFLRDEEIVVCLDNVDRFDIQHQSQILEFCIDLSNLAHIPVVLSIRTPNLRRLGQFGANADFVFLVEVSKLNAGSKTGETSEVGFSQNTSSLPATVLDIIVRRLNFVKKHNAFSELGGYFDYLGKKYSYSYTATQYIELFTEVFRKIGDTIVHEEIDQYCNHNIREILVVYFDLITKLILDPEPYYDLNEFFSKESRFWVTKLRNYFYKWLISRNEILPSALSNDLDLLESKYGDIVSPKFKILAYLCNFATSEGLLVERLIYELWRFGIDRGVVIQSLRELSDDQWFNPLTKIWIDGEKRIDENSRIYLMPSGYYFVNRFSLMREYVFWLAMFRNFDDSTLQTIFPENKLPFSRLIDDDFKLTTVANFIEYSLVPEFKEEMQQVKQRTFLPTGRTGTPVEYYCELFGSYRRLYLERLIDSVIRTIQFSSLSEERRHQLHSSLSNLAQLVKAVIAEANRV